jgi:hypothetical protein
MNGAKGLTTLPPEICVSRVVWNKLIAYSKCTVAGFGKAERSKIEISGMGLARMRDSVTFEIYDFLLVNSEGSGGTTEMDDAALDKLTNELCDAGRAEDVANMRVWWHTHPNGCLSWSSQDEKQMRDFGALGVPWFISVVTDGSGDYRARIDIWNMGGFRTYFDGVTINIAEDPSFANLVDELQKEVDEKVKRKHFSYANKTGFAIDGSDPFDVNDFSGLSKKQKRAYLTQLKAKRDELNKRKNKLKVVDKRRIHSHHLPLLEDDDDLFDLVDEKDLPLLSGEVEEDPAF